LKDKHGYAAKAGGNDLMDARSQPERFQDPIETFSGFDVSYGQKLVTA